VSGVPSIVPAKEYPMRDDARANTNGELSETEDRELQARLETLTPEALLDVLTQIVDDYGRIPTPADDGLSGEVARLIQDDDRLMKMRVVRGVRGGLARQILTVLRSHETGRFGGDRDDAEGES
jgi:hypothetical protein